MRRPIKSNIRFRIFERDHFTCVYCGRAAPDVVLHVDHVVPVAEGGDNHPDNLATACSACNGGKSARQINLTQSRQREFALAGTYYLRALCRWPGELERHPDLFSEMMGFTGESCATPADLLSIIDDANTWPECLEAMKFAWLGMTQAEWNALHPEWGLGGDE